MGFLAIPSIGLLYYFKKYHQITVKNFIVAHVSSGSPSIFGIQIFTYLYIEALRCGRNLHGKQYRITL
jgi:hypothetical protein